MKPGDADAFINDSGEVAFWGNVTTFNGNPVQWQRRLHGYRHCRGPRAGAAAIRCWGTSSAASEALGLNNAGQILIERRALKAPTNGEPWSWRRPCRPATSRKTATWTTSICPSGTTTSAWRRRTAHPGRRRRRRRRGRPGFSHLAAAVRHAHAGGQRRAGASCGGARRGGGWDALDRRPATIDAGDVTASAIVTLHPIGAKR